MSSSSRISGFHKLSIPERLQKVAENSPASLDTLKVFEEFGNLPAETADRMIENVIGSLSIPVGVATNMVIDGKDVLIPMATEESSVVAAVCNAARQCRDSGGFITSTTGSLMIAQIQLTNVADCANARLKILERIEEIRTICNDADPLLIKLGGGFYDVDVRMVKAKNETMLVTHIIVDTRDAMGANTVNTMAEKLAPVLAGWTGGKPYLRILSNLADRRLARARAVWTPEAIGGTDVRDGMMQAYYFAEADPYRAATHNKGIMNGVSAVVLATGNDTRAVESGAHAYAAHSGRYTSLTTWEVDADGNLCGSIEIPMPVGLVGGATKIHPVAKASLEILGVQTAEDLAKAIAAVGLAQNFAAMRALATDGIQKGHMGLHAKNIAVMAGAVGDEIDTIAKTLVQLGTVRVDVAEQELAKLRTS
ncbi:hydroxymethylglutaryl-CoA reductase, degradative [Terasakiella pusilla]|uniref:hydroxymethylglutaryl-CoA reductase, degradative n=1 Tax=Terasakiella pusilla TaxID=64973 RepID=UPI000570803A|nr:hydroxymethylglutaryl-CoA reductase, degradative [Terasakiella pusilla]